MTDILALIKSHAWVPLVAIVVGFLIRIAKDDPAVAWFPISVPSKWRPWLALVLGAVAGVVDKVADGATWTSAIGSGLVAALMAMGAHDTIIESARNGREIGEKKASPSKPEALAKIVPPVALLALVAALGGCASLGGKGPAIEHGIGDVVECVLGHYLSGERDPVIIAETCAIADWHDVQAIIDAHKRAMAKDAECAPSGAK